MSLPQLPSSAGPSRTPRVFTVREANELLPEMERHFEAMDRLRTVVEHGTGQLQILDVLWGDRVLDPSNPDHGEFLQVRQSIRAAIGSLEDVVRGEILAQGIRFPPGGLEHGLLDFPSTFQGRPVLLCWCRGESEIQAWHEEHTGFRGRKELSGEQSVQMGREPGQGGHAGSD